MACTLIVLAASAVDERSTVMKMWFVVLTGSDWESEDSEWAPPPKPVEIVPSRVSDPGTKVPSVE